MPRFSFLIDIPLVVIAFVVTLGGMLIWVYRTEQYSVPRTGDTVSRLTFRLSIVTGLIGAACYFTGIAFWFVAIVVMVLMLLAFLGDVFGLAGLPIIVLGYLIKEYVLGFPEIVLSPRDRTQNAGTKQRETHKMVGRTTVTTAPLRPQGDISIDGETFNAASDSGTMIATGVLVEVIGSRNGNLLVSESENGG